MFLWYFAPLIISLAVSFALCYFLVGPLAIPKTWKLLLELIVALAPLRFFWCFVVGGTIWNPNLPPTLAFLLDCLFFSSLTLLMLLMLRGLINTAPMLLKQPDIISAASLRNAAIMLAIALLIGVNGTINGYSTPDVTRYTVAVQNLPIEANGYKIAFLTDTHVSRTTSEDTLRETVNRVNALKPDLVLFGGDMQDGSVESLRGKLAILAKAQGRDGTFAVAGNHERYSGYNSIKAFFEKEAGMTFLDNTSAIVRHATTGRPILAVAGITDPAVDRPNTAGAVHELDWASRQDGENSPLPVIMLSHRPWFFSFAPPVVDLMLSGHTHGGQSPILSWLVASKNAGFVSGPYERKREFEKRYAKATPCRITLKDTAPLTPPGFDMTDPGKQYMIVSAGVSQWMGWTFRLFNDPEIVEVTLIAAGRS